MKAPREPGARALAERWQALGASRPVVRWLDTLLRAYGQVLFADHPLTGLCMAAAVALIGPGALLLTALGAALSSLAALALGEERSYVRAGLFGFNGVLLGLFWGWYFTLSWPSVALFVPMALLVAPLQAALMRHLSWGRYNLPVLSLPAAILLVVSLMAGYWLVYSAGLFPPADLYPPLPPPRRAPEGLAGLLGNGSLAVWGLILAGIAVHSRISALAALVAAGAGLAATALLPPLGQSAATVFVGFNLLPLAVGLGGVFLVPGGRAVRVTAAAGLVCLLAWIGLCNLLRPLNLPFLTLPFNLTVLGTLVWARHVGPERAGVRAVPLTAITTPEAQLGAAGAGQSLGKWLLSRRRRRREADAFLARLRGASRVAVLSGAGTSTEAGIPDFRGHGNFWRAGTPDTFTIAAFLARPEIRRRFWVLEARFQARIRAARPHALHRFVRRLEAEGRLEVVVTQNVDGLFQKAGIDPGRVLEVHGSAARIRCLACGAVADRDGLPRLAPSPGEARPCPRCGGLLKPDTVLMGEEVDAALLHEATARILAADLLIVTGTSLAVAPVASLPALARERGVAVVVVNGEPTPADPFAVQVVHDRAGGFFAAVLRRMPP